MEQTAQVSKLKEQKPRWDYDDKDLAMVGIVILCVVGGIVLASVGQAGAAIGALFTGGVTALGSLASGRKQGNTGEK
jgi:hypothetical protein